MVLITTVKNAFLGLGLLLDEGIPVWIQVQYGDSMIYSCARELVSGFSVQQ
jgi:hypothetical protein